MEVISHEDLAAGLSIIILLYFIGLAVLYVYSSICLQMIAKKTNTPNGWMAWIPMANLYLSCLIARKPVWWIVLFFIPIANIVATIIIWMGIAKTRGKPNWWGILLIVPLVNLVVPGYLAFSK